MTQYSDLFLQNVFDRTKVIAVIGASANPARPSHYVSLYLQEQGYRVIPVNPGLEGGQLFGETVYASVADIPRDIQVDMIDIFRRSDQVAPIVEQARAHLPGLQTVWMQLGVVNQAAAEAAEAAGVDVVMDRCPKIELPRLQARSA